MVLAYDTTVEHGEERLRLSGSHCSKQFVETHRVVSVWSAMSHPTEFSDGSTNDLQIAEQGWYVVEQAPNVPKAAIFRFYTQWRPKMLYRGLHQGDGTNNHSAGAFVDSIMEALQKTSDVAHQTVEDMLLQRQVERTRMSAESAS